MFLFETIQIRNGVVVAPQYHEERMKRSAMQLFGMDLTPRLREIIEVPVEYRQGTVKCRLSYDIHSTAIEFSLYHPKQIRQLKIIRDDDIVYDHKYTDRKRIEELLMRRGNCDDILIIKNGHVTDTSYSNIIFCNGKDWVTPTTFLLKGTMRQRLLEEGRITEQDVREDEIRCFREFKLINAMLDPAEWSGLDIRNILF